MNVKLLLTDVFKKIAIIIIIIIIIIKEILCLCVIRAIQWGN